ncbi:hypothetical protein CEXT_793861 [Caerostris extrusa]|uniref:Uncharacterized protein n=1 Tax=Caerostris extrusa TaxID=172846 RepID=A0AAV4QE04_CAEEX|nr:hypothetical protein CEXT_793861 [Caerostris extrusa]
MPKVFLVNLSGSERSFRSLVPLSRLNNLNFLHRSKLFKICRKDKADFTEESLIRCNAIRKKQLDWDFKRKKKKKKECRVLNNVYSPWSTAF